MSLSTKLSKVASKVIKKFGVKVTFTQKTVASFDSVTGIDTATTSAFTGFGVKDTYNKAEIDGTLVIRSDIKLIFEKTTKTPAVKDTCTIGSDVYRVMNVMNIDPANESIIYEVQLRA